MEKPILIHTHFHRRKTGVTRSIENVLGYFNDTFDSYVYGVNIDGNQLSRKQFQKFLFSNKKVIVHCHRNNEILRMLWYRLLGAKFKLIATRHSSSSPSKLTHFLIKKSDKVVTLIPEMSHTLGIPNTLIGHGVETAFFKPKKGVKLPKIAQPNIILNTGRIRKAKGQLDLVKAASLLKEHTDWALVSVGRVDKLQFLEELKSLAYKQGIANQVYFMDETRDILSYYQAAKIMVAPSYSEGFSLVTAEAMSCGCVTIASKNVGVHDDLITHGTNGYLFDVSNIDQLQTLLKEAISKPKSHIGIEARKTIEEKWSAEKEANALTDLYLQ